MDLAMHEIIKKIHQVLIFIYIFLKVFDGH